MADATTSCPKSLPHLTPPLIPNSYPNNVDPIHDKMIERQQIKTASRQLAQKTSAEIDAILLSLADSIESATDAILHANRQDLQRMDPADPRYDRLSLTKDRIAAISQDCRNVAALPSPLGRVLRHTVLPNGLELTRVSVPFGVIGVIYEARPNVTLDVTALCLKAGSACILKGGSDARDTNKAIHAIIQRTLEAHQLHPSTVTLLPSEREATEQLLALASPEYFSEGGEIGHFLLKHGVGHKPGKSEIDTPLDYGDYYFLEALLRFRELKAVARPAATVCRAPVAHHL